MRLGACAGWVRSTDSRVARLVFTPLSSSPSEDRVLRNAASSTRGSRRAPCSTDINKIECVKLVIDSLSFCQLFFGFSLQNNIGHKLLVKQGWQEGQGLGKQLQGTESFSLLPPL